MVLLKMHSEGYNAVRVSWYPPYSPQPQETWGYNSNWMDKFLTLAKKLDIWIIVDCHGWYQHYEHEDEWIGWWSEIISQFKNNYAKIIWEPQNEPIMVYGDGSNRIEGQEALDELARIYNRWILMCRSLGDTHWIVVSGLTSLPPIPHVDRYPIVNDSLNRIFYSLHFYFFYEYEMWEWTVERAEKIADIKAQLIKDIIAKYGRPFMPTEIGADPYTTNYGFNEVPDAQYPGSAGYSTTSLAFTDRLVSDLKKNNLGYIIWMAGDWSSAGLYGALDVWGQYIPIPTPIPTPISSLWVLISRIVGPIGVGLYMIMRKPIRRG